MDAVNARTCIRTTDSTVQTKLQEYLTDIALDKSYFLYGPGASVATADDEATALTLLDGDGERELDDEEVGMSVVFLLRLHGFDSHTSSPITTKPITQMTTGPPARPPLPPAYPQQALAGADPRPP